jgi:hypothetical protein
MAKRRRREAVRYVGVQLDARVCDRARLARVWTGDWDAYGLDEGNKLVARARVDVILDGCALLEIYEQLDGLTGQSFSIYDASRGTWHQTWVTNRGKLLTLEGRFQDGRMTLTGTDRSAD